MGRTLPTIVQLIHSEEDAWRSFRRALTINPNLKDARDSLAMATGEQPLPPESSGPAAERGPTAAPAPSPSQPLPMSVPQSPTLGPAAP